MLNFQVYGITTSQRHRQLQLLQSLYNFSEGPDDRPMKAVIMKNGETEDFAAPRKSLLLFSGMHIRRVFCFFFF